VALGSVPWCSGSSQGREFEEGIGFHWQGVPDHAISSFSQEAGH
jgi:hypothetical protein